MLLKKQYGQEEAPNNTQPKSKMERDKNDAEIDSIVHLHTAIFEKVLIICHQLDPELYPQHMGTDPYWFTNTAIFICKSTMQKGHYDLACSFLNKLYDMLLSTHLHRTQHQNIITYTTYLKIVHLRS